MKNIDLAQFQFDYDANENFADSYDAIKMYTRNATEKIRDDFLQRRKSEMRPITR